MATFRSPGKNSEHLAVDVVDGGGKEKQGADDPAIPADTLCTVSTAIFASAAVIVFRKILQLKVRPLLERRRYVYHLKSPTIKAKKSHSELKLAPFYRLFRREKMSLV